MYIELTDDDQNVALSKIGNLPLHFVQTRQTCFRRRTQSFSMGDAGVKNFLDLCFPFKKHFVNFNPSRICHVWSSVCTNTKKVKIKMRKSLLFNQALFLHGLGTCDGMWKCNKNNSVEFPISLQYVQANFSTIIIKFQYKLYEGAVPVQVKHTRHNYKPYTTKIHTGLWFGLLSLKIFCQPDVCGKQRVTELNKSVFTVGQFNVAVYIYVIYTQQFEMVEVCGTVEVGGEN